MSTTTCTSTTSSIPEDVTNSTAQLGIPAPTYTKTLPFMLLFLLAAVENVIGCVFMIKSKKTNDAISTALVGLAISGVFFSVNGVLNVSIYLYISFKSPEGVPFMLCSITFYCWFLSILISTEQMFIISLIRVVSILKIQKMSAVAGGFTRRKATILSVVMWSLSTLCCTVTMAVDYAKAPAPAPFCRFRSSVGLFRITTIYFVVMYICSYSACVLIYCVSITILAKVHYSRRQVDKTEEPKRILPGKDFNSEISTVCDSGLNKITVQHSRLSKVRVAWASINEKASICHGRLTRRRDQVSMAQTTTMMMESLASTSNYEQPYNSRNVYRRNTGKRPGVLIATFIIGLLIVVHSVSVIPWIVQMILVMGNTESVSRLFQAMLFAVVNFLVNPFIYIMSLPNVRGKVVSCVKCPKNN